ARDQPQRRCAASQPRPEGETAGDLGQGGKREDQVGAREDRHEAPHCDWALQAWTDSSRRRKPCFRPRTLRQACKAVPKHHFARLLSHFLLSCLIIGRNNIETANESEPVTHVSQSRHTQSSDGAPAAPVR